MTPALPSPSDLQIGRSFSVPLRVTEDDLDAFMRLSGDTNSLHSDGAYARAHGFKGRVVYGALLVAAVSRLIGVEFPGEGWVWHSLTLQFKAPLYVDEAATVAGTVHYVGSEATVVQIDILIQRDGQTLAKGRVQNGVLPR